MSKNEKEMEKEKKGNLNALSFFKMPIPTLNYSKTPQNRSNYDNDTKKEAAYDQQKWPEIFSQT